MEKYKDDALLRAAGVGAVDRDLFAGLPAEANQIYVRPRRCTSRR